MLLTSAARDLVSAVALAVICLVTLGNEAGAGGSLWWAVGAGLVLYVALNWRRLPLACHVIISAVVATMIVLVARGELSLALAAEASFRAGYFAFFLTCLAWLALAARSSPTIRRCGLAALDQPPSRRYAVLTLTAHLLAFLLLAGAGGLLGSAIRAGTTLSEATPDPEVNAARRRRMTTAVTRGAGIIVFWTPTSLFAAYLLTVIPGLQWGDFALPGVCFAALALASGILFDWATKPRRLAGRVPPVTGDWRGLGNFGAIVFLIVLIFGTGTLLDAVTPLGQLVSLLTCAFAVAMGWLVIQSPPGRRFRGAWARVRGEFVPLMSGQRAEVSLFGAAAVLGILLSHILSPEATEAFIAGVGLGDAGTLIMASWLILILGQIGVSPIITVSLIAEPLWHLPSASFGLLPLLFSLLVPAAVYSFTSGFSVIVRLTALAVDESPRTVGLKWNGGFGLLLMLALNLGIVLAV